MHKRDKLTFAVEKFLRVKDYDHAFQCVYRLYEDRQDYEVLRFFRKSVKESDLDPQKKLDFLKRSYLVSARDYLDDYMLYIEWNREPEKRFWLNRRDILLPVCEAIQDLIDDKLDLLCVSLPPGTGKSTLKNFTLSWLLGKYPDKPNLDSGHAGSMTQSTYDGVLEILQDPEYLWKDVFPEHISIITNAKELTIDIDKKHRFSTLTCRAIGASLTGATRCEGVLSADDLVSGLEEAVSIDRLNKKWDTYTSDLKSRKKMGAKELHIATRWSVHDVIGRLNDKFSKDPRAKFIVIPALNENDESNFNYKNGVGFDTKYFHEMREAEDDVSFKALYMNDPIEREGLLYKEEELRRFYELPDGEPDAILSICDTAEGGGDDTFMPVGYVYGQDHYIIDCVVDDSLPQITDERCANLLVKWKVQQCQFESNSAGGRTADSVQNKVKEKGGRCHITKKKTTQNKETKIIVNSSWVKEHCLFLDEAKIQKGSDYSKLIKKLCSYTHMGKNKHDDIPDGMAQYALFCENLVGNVAQIVKRPF